MIKDGGYDEFGDFTTIHIADYHHPCAGNPFSTNQAVVEGTTFPLLNTALGCVSHAFFDGDDDDDDDDDDDTDEEEDDMMMMMMMMMTKTMTMMMKCYLIII